MTRAAMKRITEAAPLSRYSRDDLSLLRELAFKHRMQFIEPANKGDALAKVENHRLKTLIAKLEDDMKMHP